MSSSAVHLSYKNALNGMFVLFVVLLLYTLPSRALAFDIRAENAAPSNNAVFYDTDTITFIGAVQNLAEPVAEAGWADVIIDWGSDGINPQNINANPGGNSMIGPVTDTKTLEEVVSNPPIGTHRYRFSVDTTDQLKPESDEDNNKSPWVTFSVIARPLPPTITFSASQNPVTLGNSTTLVWGAVGATSCTASGGWNGAKDKDGGVEPISPATTTLYILTCTGPGGTAIKNFTVDVVAPAPNITFTISSSTITYGGTTTIGWSVTNATNCDASGAWSGAKTASGSINVSPAITSTYTLTCTGLGGSTLKDQTITVNVPPPTITFTASPNPASSGSSIDLTWNTNADACTASVAAGGGGSGAGSWSGSKPVNGTAKLKIINQTTYRLTCTGSTGATAARDIVVTISGLPDLTYGIVNYGQYLPTSIDPTKTQPLVAGQPNTFFGKIYNQGVASTGRDFPYVFRAAWGWTYPIIMISGATSSPVDPGASTTVESLTFTPLMSGHVEVSFCQDYSTTSRSVIPETNESNNCVYRNIDVAGQQGSPSTTLTFGRVMTDPPVRITKFGTSTTYTVAWLEVGATTTLSWTASDATSCTGRSSRYEEGWSGASLEPNGGSVIISPTATTSYTITCTGPKGTVVKSARINAVMGTPQVNLLATPTSLIKGASSTITWSTLYASSCVAKSIPADPDWDGMKSRLGGSDIVSPTVTTEYFLSCNTPFVAGVGGGGTTTVSTKIDVADPAAAVTLTSPNNPILAGEEATLNWIVSNATQCDASGGWSGKKKETGGSEVVKPNVTTTYTLTCIGTNGQAVPASFTVTVTARPPEVTLSFVDKKGNPVSNTIIEGETARLQWEVKAATKCTASLGWSGDKNKDGGVEDVAPTVTTKYAIECVGPWGSTTPDITLNVVPKAKIELFKLCDIKNNVCVPTDTASLEVKSGTTLSAEWRATNASFCTGSGFSTNSDIQGVDQTMADPEVRAGGEDSTYTLTCGNAGIPTTVDPITIHVNPVTPRIDVSRKIVEPSGGKVTVEWDTNNGDQTVCSISGADIPDNILSTEAGKDPTKGSYQATVKGRTTFKITCGEETDTASVELGPRIRGI